jgi:hypothetical protein
MSLRSLVPARVRRSAAELADVADLRSAVVASLSAAPINEIALRRNVWTLVGTERDAGASPSCVIQTLTDLVDEAALTPTPARQARLRQVILWCVEAYFRYLGDDILQREIATAPSRPQPTSNR